MKITCYLHGYLPELNAGSETAMHTTLKFLQQCGHEVTVLVAGKVSKKKYDGLRIVEAHTDEVITKHAGSADVLFTHLRRTGHAINLAASLSKPLVYFAHNGNDVPQFRVRPKQYRIVYNTHHLQQFCQQQLGYDQDSIVLHPPTFQAEYDTRQSKLTRQYVTLFNCNAAKGGHVLIELARRLPDVSFLGVLGSYGEQVKEELPNLTYAPNTPDVLDYYAQSRIVIMPSAYESYGKVALEAYCSGIPVIASPTAGLKEAMGEGGLFAAHTDVDEYEKQIKKLLADKKYYAKAAAYALARAEALPTQAELEAFESWLTQ